MDATVLNKSFLSILLPLCMLALSACAISPPVQEMSDARQAIRAAQEAHADKHAPDVLHQAEGLMTEAAKRLEQGAYEDARRAAIAAKKQAVVARDRAVDLESGLP